MKRSPSSRRAFTLIELIAVIVVLAILAGVALPKYFDYAAQAKESAVKGALGGMRAGIANYYANSAISGTPTYPTVAQLGTPGVVMQEPLPNNPYGADPAAQNDVRDATGEYDPAAATQAVDTTNDEGWAYDPTAGKAWANTSTTGENGW